MHDIEDTDAAATAREAIVAWRGLKATKALADGVEVVAMGDVHGRADVMAALLAHAAALPRKAPRRVFVHTGDVIDRGPDSIRAWRMAEDAARLAAADEVVDLMGNHEQMARMALALPDPEAGLTGRVIDKAIEVWDWNGGGTVVASLQAETGRAFGSAGELFAALRDEMGPRLSRLVSHWRCGDVMFVHAGLNPDIPLDAMLAAPWVQHYPTMVEGAHWAWIRNPFLHARPGDAGHHGLFVVHGHSPKGHLDRVGDEQAAAAHSRLNLDGGSYGTGVVRMARMVGRDIDLYEAAMPGE